MDEGLLSTALVSAVVLLTLLNRQVSSCCVALPDVEQGLLHLLLLDSSPLLIIETQLEDDFEHSLANERLTEGTDQEFEFTLVTNTDAVSLGGDCGELLSELVNLLITQTNLILRLVYWLQTCS